MSRRQDGGALHTDSGGRGDGDLRAGGHIAPVGLYLAIFVALIVLTTATVAIAFVDLGPLNTPVAIAIAVIKAILVILYFMHVRWSPRLTWIVAGAAFLWLALLVGGLLVDYLSRPWLGDGPV
jgi:cytochrome c oxidase subunit 4